MNRRKALMGTLATFLAIGAGNVALAGTNYPAGLKMGYSGASGGSFAGKLRSSRKCKGGRRVAVYRSTPGSDPSIGSTTTSANGKWGIATGKPRRGDYYAKVGAKSAGGGIRCGGARTATTHVS
ncbi:MAG: hypothetical protein IPK93_07090 [Solirubrobacterales bacterium]|nr:hypothetical protein [Solirubrobacterales bacterium]